MAYLPPALSYIAGAALLALVVLHVLRGDYRPQKLIFVALAVMMAAIELCQGTLLLQTDVGRALLWLRVLTGLTILLPAVATPFFMVFGKRDDHEILRRRLPWVIAGVVGAGAAALLLPVRLVVSDVHFLDGRFWGLSVSEWGRLVGVYVVVTNVAFLFLLENTYRAATIPEKVTLKYPMLGMVTASVVTLVAVSRVLAISLLDRNFMAVHSAGLIAMSLALFFATVRYRLFDVRVYVGRQVTASVISLSIAGAYLVALALVTYLAGAMGLPYDRLTLQVLIVFAVFLLVAVLMSGRARRRVRRFVNENFYFNRFDYRKEWREFAHLVAASERMDVYLTNFITALCESMMVQRGVIWVDIGRGISGTYGLDSGDAVECVEELRALDLEAGEVRLLGPGAPVIGDGDAVRAVASLGSTREALGLIVLGGKAMALTYTDEDRDFLAMLADQATLAIENYQLSDILVDTRQMETFDRFASFVVHDLKNTVGMLSLTADNARDNIGDADFQRDTIETIRHSVAKMQSLIDSLRALDTDPALRREWTDVPKLVAESIAPLKAVAEARGMSLDLVAAPAIKAELDRQAVERALENLVFNALDASKPGGTVKVRIARDGEAWLRILVEDTGAGFDPDYLQGRVFRPFQTTKKEGLGIGLLMCKTVAVAHGGDVDIESRPGVGSTVSIRLPVRTRDH